MKGRSMFQRHERDRQRSAVYAWEKVASKGAWERFEFETLEECRAWLDPIWRTERGRYGRPGLQAPRIERPNWGQRRGIAHVAEHRITMPRWTRSKWYLLHELAHCLNPHHEVHGARFVAIFMGLLARHAGWDVKHLMETADAMGVRYQVRTIGSVPVFTLTARIAAALREEGPMSPMDLAAWIDVRYFSVWGALMGMLRRDEAAMRRGVIHLRNEECAGGDAEHLPLLCYA